MISYEPLWQTMKRHGATTYTLQAKAGISSSTIRRMQANESVSTNTLDTLCKFFNCELDGIVKFLPDGTISQEILEKGHHYVEVALNEVPLFIRKGCAIPVADFAESIPDIKEESIRMVGYEGASYERYTDDGVSRI